MSRADLNQRCESGNHNQHRHERLNLNNETQFVEQKNNDLKSESDGTAEARDATTSDMQIIPPAVAIHMPIRFRILLALSSCAMSISASTISFYCVNEMNLEPVQLTHYWMFMSWSALLCPIIGFLSDTVNIAGENRRPLVIVGAMVSMMIFLLFAFVNVTTDYYTVFVALSLLQSWAQSFITVPINGMLVEMFIPTDGVDDSVDAKAVKISENVGNKTALPVSVSPHVDGDTLRVESEANSSAAAKDCEEETRKAYRVAVMSAAQAQAMVFRSLGSLFGSVLYTVLVIWMSLASMLWVSGICYGVIVPSVLLLSRSWCQNARRTRNDLENSKRKDRESVKNDNHGNDQGAESDTEPLLATERCMGCKRKFKSLYDRLLLGGWDWRKPSQGKIGLLFVLLFVFIYSGTLDGGSAYFAFVATQFEFPNWLNSLNSSVGMLGSVVGAYVYGWFIRWIHRRDELRRHKMRNEEISNQNENAEPQTSSVPVANVITDIKNSKRSEKRITTAFSLFVFGSICGSLGYLTNVALASDFIPSVVPIPPYLFVPFDNFLTSLFSRFAFMPIMTVAAERCPAGYEAAVFELFAVASLLGGSLSAYLSGLATVSLGITSKDYSNLWILLCICAGVKFVPVGLAAILPVHEKSATAMLAAAIAETKKQDDEEETRKASA